MADEVAEPGYLLDVNVWFALEVGTHPHHERVRAWLDGLNEPSRFFFCRATQQGLLRLLTTASVMALYGEPPCKNTEAWQIYDATVRDKRVAFYSGEPDRVDDQWRLFAGRPSASPKLWMDAYLAAFALAGGLTLVTTDSAFRQFEGLDALVLGTGR